jgi:methionyl aminopeptidase
MHEPPQVPNYTNKEMRQQDFRLEPGLTLAIEPMVNMGKKDVQELPDNWTVITRDRLPSAHVEHTVAITETGVEVLTQAE